MDIKLVILIIVIVIIGGALVGYLIYTLNKYMNTTKTTLKKLEHKCELLKHMINKSDKLEERLKDKKTEKLEITINDLDEPKLIFTMLKKKEDE